MCAILTTQIIKGHLITSSFLSVDRDACARPYELSCGSALGRLSDDQRLKSALVKLGTPDAGEDADGEKQ